MKNYKLKLKQFLDLETKIMLSKKRIIDWYEYFGGKVYISFSGGKDSTVLLDLVRKTIDEYNGKGSEVVAVFCDTGLEFPEIKEFIRTIDNVIWLKPKMNFRKVLEYYGYPVISKEQSQFISQYRNAKSEKTKKTRLYGNKYGRGKISNKWLYLINSDFNISEKCCDIMKKNPSKKFEKETGLKSYIGIMAEESDLRKQSYDLYGCNSFDAERKSSRPLIFWKEKDIWEYIKTFNVSYSNIYDIGYERTGCVFCMFGCHLEENPNRFQKLYKTHRQLWDYCMKDYDKGGLGLSKVLKEIGVDPIPEQKLEDLWL